MEQIDEIAATPGLDALFIGTSDLSFSLGLRGQMNHPKHQDAVAKVVDAARRHHKFLGRPAGNPDQVKQFREQGFQFFQAPTELVMLASGARQYLQPLGKWAEDSSPRGIY